MPKRREARNRGQGYRERNVDIRDIRERFLLVCEGTQTEPNYFRSFRVAHKVITVRGVGNDPVRVVQQAIKLSTAGDYDQVWAVFDRDTFTANDFNHALDLAHKNKVQVAYSNQAFELWYLLHFHYYHTAMTRTQYIEKLSDVLGHPYQKNSETLFDELVAHQATAIDNAERLLGEYNPPNPERDDPSTTVHLLVEQLLRYVR